MAQLDRLAAKNITIRLGTTLIKSPLPSSKASKHHSHYSRLRLRLPVVSAREAFPYWLLCVQSLLFLLLPFVSLKAAGCLYSVGSFICLAFRPQGKRGRPSFPLPQLTENRKIEWVRKTTTKEKRREGEMQHSPPLSLLLRAKRRKKKA